LKCYFNSGREDWAGRHKDLPRSHEDSKKGTDIFLMLGWQQASLDLFTQQIRQIGDRQTLCEAKLRAFLSVFVASCQAFVSFKQSSCPINKKATLHFFRVA